ncbi:MAG: hypothetical protein COV45_05050 [Deltaproteobacteria bacterium CG11_big_fil_rev_8_21_14_0_20_47_16]|nr:MAG: hypothetical protein COV45_05050 [Deltaproteobacteria bacterium CG11_big_fil_rev_8_21_14_0_20_47_16]
MYSLVIDRYRYFYDHSNPIDDQTAIHIYNSAMSDGKIDINEYSQIKELYDFATSKNHCPESEPGYNDGCYTVKPMSKFAENLIYNGILKPNAPMYRRYQLSAKRHRELPSQFSDKTVLGGGLLGGSVGIVLGGPGPGALGSVAGLIVGKVVGWGGGHAVAATLNLKDYLVDYYESVF